MNRPFLRAALLAALLAGCSDDEERRAVAVRDDAGLLSAADLQALQAVQFPPGVLALVRTTPTLTQSPGLPGDLTERMKQDPYWDEAQPRGFVEKLLSSVPETAVWVLVSQSPRRLFVRFGGDLVVPALGQGVHSGPGYRRWQDEHAAAPDMKALVDGLGRLAAALQQGLDAPWYEKLLGRGDIGGFVTQVLDDWLDPGDGPFTRWALAPMAKLTGWVAAKLSGLGAVWVVIALAVLGFLLEGPSRWLGRPVTRRLRERKAAMWASLLVRAAWSMAVLAAATSALLLLSSGRWEDARALELMGARAPDTLGDLFGLLAAPTAWWVALLAAFFDWLVGWGEREIPLFQGLAELPDAHQQRLFAAMPEANRSVLQAERRLGLLNSNLEGDEDEKLLAEEFARHPFSVIYGARHEKFVQRPIKWGLGLLVLPGVLGVYLLVSRVLRTPGALAKGARGLQSVEGLKPMLEQDAAERGQAEAEPAAQGPGPAAETPAVAAAPRDPSDPA